MIINTLVAVFEQSKNEYNGTVYAINKSKLLMIPPFLEFRDISDNILDSNLEYQDNEYFYYIIRFNAKIGTNKIYIHASDVDNSNINAFSDYINMKTANAGRLQFASNVPTSFSQSAYNGINFQNTFNSEFTQLVDGFQFNGNRPNMIRVRPSVQNRNSVGDTWEMKIEHNNLMSHFTHGFGFRPAAQDSSWAASMVKGNTYGTTSETINRNYINNSPITPVTFKTNLPPQTVIKEIVGVSVFENGSNTYVISEDYATKIESGYKELAPNNLIQTEDRFELKVFGGGYPNVSYHEISKIKLFWIRKRTNPINNTYTIENAPIPP